MSNLEARADAKLLTDEQTALRRVATLVADGVPPSRLFDAVVREVGVLLEADVGGMIRYESDDAYTVVGRWVAGGEQPPVGMRWSLEGDDFGSAIARTRNPVRIDDYEGRSGRIAAFLRDELGVRSSVGCPVVVDGEVWGGLFVHSRHARPLPAATEARLENFTELVGTAIANAQSRAQVEQLAAEQAALRRVATLVAEDVLASELFGAVAHEVGTLFGADLSGMIRYEDDASVTTVATWAAVGEHPPVADRWTPEPGDPASTIARTRQTVRMDDWPSIDGPIAAHIRGELGVRSTVASPIIVDGRLWGAVALHSRGESLAADTESRLLNFTHLVATAIANSSARAEVARLVEEQTALRRVATLVARGASPTAVFDAVAAEMAALLSADGITLCRYEEGGDVTILAHFGSASRRPAARHARRPRQHERDGDRAAHWAAGEDGHLCGHTRADR